MSADGVPWCNERVRTSNAASAGHVRAFIFDFSRAAHTDTTCPVITAGVSRAADLENTAHYTDRTWDDRRVRYEANGSARRSDLLIARAARVPPGVRARVSERDVR